MAENDATDDPRTEEMKREMAQHFKEFEYEYRYDEHTDAEVVYEDDECIVVADYTGHELNEWASDFDVTSTELSEWTHNAARRKCDRDWSVTDPVVFDKLE